LTFNMGVFDGWEGESVASRENSAMQIAIEEVVADMMERGADEAGYEVELEMKPMVADEWAAPLPTGTSSFIVLDDRTSLANDEVSLEWIIGSLKASGWTADADLDLVAESAVAMARCQGAPQAGEFSSIKMNFDCEYLDQFRLEQGVEGILWITTIRDAGASAVVEGAVLTPGAGIRAIFFADEAIEILLDDPPFIEVQGLWPDGTRETVQVPFQSASLEESSSLRLDIETNVNQVIDQALNKVRNETQDAIQEIEVELDQSRSTLQKAFEQLQKIPDGGQFHSGPMTIRIAA